MSAFQELGAHPRLSQAIQKRGYEAPTPVQAAVLGAPPRDLLVSSQTGSGKTVAFGLVMGGTLLGEQERVTPSRTPRALVIAPTRELAQQVKRELSWLFADTGARIISCTGGTDLRLDSKSLQRGVEIVVGTPGRLVDLMERKSLDLSAIQMLVLDEADEMLDMGFRESLEVILAGSPVERRTLLFSATLPAAIRTLAKKYQRDAFSVDPRSSQAPTTHHEDIEYVAHLCAHGENFAALVNVLRMADDDRALVFCRTRESVANLHRQLTLKGFVAAAISGDRAQAERDRALDALRSGRVRILIATNVAARGIDLPDLGIVVHADLPENAEALTHRSGRTGRAGKKGVSIFIVDERSRRRAEHLFSNAKLRLKWTAPPTAEAILAHELERIRQETIAALADSPSEAAQSLATQVLETHDARTVVAALLERTVQGASKGETLTAVSVDRSRSMGKSASTPRAQGPMVLFEINLGHKDRVNPRWLLPIICRRGGVDKRDVGAIRITHNKSFVEISDGEAARFAERVAKPDAREPHVRIELARQGAEVPRFNSPPPRRGAPKPHSAPPPQHDPLPQHIVPNPTPQGARPKQFGAPAKPYGGPPKQFGGPRKPYGGAPKQFGGPAKPYGGPHKTHAGPAKSDGAPVKPDAPPPKHGAAPPKHGAPARPFGKPHARGPGKPHPLWQGGPPNRPHSGGHQPPRRKPR